MRTNREFPPDFINIKVEELVGDRPFDNLDKYIGQDEIRAFQQIFAVPANETRNVARLYDLAKQDIAGYEAYAERMARLCGSGRENCAMLGDILDAGADGATIFQNADMCNATGALAQRYSDRHAELAAIVKRRGDFVGIRY